MKTKLLLMLLVAAALSVSAVAGPVTILNAGFEDDIIADGDYLDDAYAWFDGFYDVRGGPRPWLTGNSSSGPENPGTTSYATGTAPEGQNVAYCGNWPGYDMGLYQTLGCTLTKFINYTLTAKVGNPLYNPGGTVGDYIIEIVDSGGKVVWDTTGTAPANGTWADVTLGPVSRSSGGVAYGQPIEIRILQADYTGTGDAEHYLNFDAITLTHDKANMSIETPDMITWDGQGVALNATGYNGIVSQTWTADPSGGVEFTNTDNTSKDPTVTIIPPGGGLVSTANVINAGFEDRLYGNGGWEKFPWTGTGWLRQENWRVGDYNPYPTEFDVEAYEGENDAFCAAYDDSFPTIGFYQILGDTLKANVVYTLTVQVGNTGRNIGWPGYHVELMAGDIVLAEDSNTNTVDPNAWVMSTVVYDSGATPAQEDEPLQIRLSTLGLYVANSENEDDVSEVHYDDVKLISNVPAFNPPDAYPVTLTLTGHDGSDPVDPVTVKIDVYRDACTATLAAGLAEDTDLDRNCIAGLTDLAIVLDKWTQDFNLTEPVDD